MNKRLKWISIAVLGAVSLIGCDIGDADEGPVKAYGNVEIREVNLAFRVGGRVEDVTVEEGVTVEPGAELAHLDAEPLRHQLEAAEAQAKAAQADWERLTNGFRPEEIAQAVAQVAQAQAALERVSRDLERQRSLTATNAGTQQQLDHAEASYVEAQAQLQVAQANLDLLNAGYRKEDIAAARATLEQAQATVAQLQLQVEDTVLKAPSTGTVLVRAIEPGSFVAAGQTALTLSLADRTWVRAYIPEPQLGAIHPGMSVRVQTDSSEKTYAGHIGFIAAKAEFTPKNVETEDLRTDLVFRFRVVLDAPDDGLRQGMPVTVLFGAEDE